MIEATAWGRLPRFLIHDRDRVWGGDFVARLAAIGIKSVTTPIRAPNANSIGERVVGSLRRECLDHIIILGERHQLAEFVAYYNHDRPHRTLGLETPVSSVRSLSGEVRSRPILGGLHHAYERAA
jgi:transposase InsO family protein